MSNFNQRDYIASYHKKNIIQVNLKLNRVHDASIIAHLERQKNKQEYLKKLIISDMEKKQL